MAALDRGFMLVPDELGAHMDKLEAAGHEVELDAEGFFNAGLADQPNYGQVMPLVLTFSEARRIADAVRNLPHTQKGTR